MAQVLELQFEAAHGKPFMLSVDAPKEGLTASQVQSVMQTIVQQNIFHKDGFDIVKMESAQ